MWISYLKIELKFLPSPLLEFLFSAWFHNCLPVTCAQNLKLAFDFSSPSPQSSRLHPFHEPVPISSDLDWHLTLISSLHAKPDSNSNQLKCCWQLVSNHVPLSSKNPPNQSHQYLPSLLLSQVSMSITEILQPHFSSPWSFTDPKMLLVLSLLCTFVLTNLLSWHPILSSYYPHSISVTETSRRLEVSPCLNSHSLLSVPISIWPIYRCSST